MDIVLIDLAFAISTVVLFIGYVTRFRTRQHQRKTTIVVTLVTFAPAALINAFVMNVLVVAIAGKPLATKFTVPHMTIPRAGTVAITLV